MPRWADVVLVPLLNLALAFLVSGLVVLAIGANPLEAVRVLVAGSLGGEREIGYTLYYATTFMFTGLAVTVAFHASLFNIGGEGQAAIGGLGVAIVCLLLSPAEGGVVLFGSPHWAVTLIFAILGGGLFGAAWAAIPAWLQATRGSHIVITTIMFNFIAAALLIWLLNEVFKAPGGLAIESRRFAPEATLPRLNEMGAWVGLEFRRSPMNFSFFVALAAALFVWAFLWRSRPGYEIRAFGQSEPAAVYAGISPVWMTMVAMLVSGALAGLSGLNITMGDQERLILDAVQGAGFIGIAVALMGRNHPVGVILAAILFGILYQGGAELGFEMGVPSELIVVIQALVILFTGALENLVRFPLTRLFQGRT